MEIIFDPITAKDVRERTARMDSLKMEYERLSAELKIIMLTVARMSAETFPPDAVVNMNAEGTGVVVSFGVSGAEVEDAEPPAEIKKREKR